MKSHSTDLCANPEKYDQSSKAMESIGAVKIVKKIWKECPNGYVAAIVTDEDSTTRAKLSHNMAERVEAGTMTEAERRYVPKVPGNLGPKKTDHGELPLDHPEIRKLSDHNHFIKNYKGDYYLLVNLAKSKSQTCKADAMRLSRNLSYMMKQNTPGVGDDNNCTFEQFEIAAEASFEHHWNNHEHCGSWCQAVSWTEEEKVKNKGKYRDKVKFEKEYKQQLEVKEKYLSRTRLRRCFHKFCNNKTEQIHGFIVNVFLPKRSYFCRTICGRARTYLAVSIDSLGFEEYYKQLYLDLGIRMSPVTGLYYRQVDKRRKTDQTYAKSFERKKKRSMQKLETINNAWRIETADKRKGHTYQSGMAGPTAVSATNENEVVAGEGDVVVASRPFCKACGNYGHQRRTSRLCTQNTRSKHYQGTCIDYLRGIVYYSCLSNLISRA